MGGLWREEAEKKKKENLRAACKLSMQAKLESEAQDKILLVLPQNVKDHSTVYIWKVFTKPFYMNDKIRMI